MRTNHTTRSRDGDCLCNGDWIGIGANNSYFFGMKASSGKGKERSKSGNLGSEMHDE